MEFARRWRCWISCKNQEKKHILGKELLSLLATVGNILLYNRIRHREGGLLRLNRVVTYIEVCSSMFEDELCGVGFVLTVADIHLELVSLSVRTNTFKASVQFSISCFQKINLFSFIF